MFRNHAPREEAVSAAWQQVQAGRSVEAVVAEYPEYAAELEPLLRLALAVRNVPDPALRPAALARIQQRTRAAVLARHGSRPVLPGRPPGARSVAGLPAPPHRGWWAPRRPAVRPGFGLLLLCALAAAGLLLVALSLRPSATPAQLLTYSGRIHAMTNTQWVVDDETVIIDATTEIHGQPVVGAEVLCLGQQAAPGAPLRARTVWVRAAPHPATVTPVGLDRRQISAEVLIRLAAP
ncbi:MAG TPA: hypothetical protein VKY74_04455 [Chloroflexia bacterium]|nr:hypothetical protein [Chloroflexia bacterium]